ncbi:hypothetical protein DPMN_171143 [Dreissena polymorpha]|uniref:Uncharacterized protein n=1 Tax=Dreissena polymorpha TaxID=45954 RepID=A0A9D4E162_DREPO|nr:hypothetical protein DPMN_171143 [Dreissena polymorpha]
MLTCSTSAAPFAVVWFKTEKGSARADTVISLKLVNETNSCQANNNAMKCSCSSSQVYSCSIKSVNVTNDGQSWMCKAINHNYVSGESSNVFTLRLILPLTSLTIVPQTSVAYPVFNVVSTFTCITSLSRPAASIQWFNDNRNITYLANYSHNDDVARSDLQYISNLNGYSGGNISCIAKYNFKSITNILIANTSIEVQFPVSKPIVTINNISLSTAPLIREGRLVHLNCFSSGYPPAHYQWTYPAGQSTGAILNIQFTRNNGRVSCMAHNVLRTLDGVNTAQATEEISVFNINVLYPPVRANLSNKDNNVEIIDSTIRVERGDNVNIVCSSDANPPATVFWHGQLDVSATLTVTSVQHDALWTCQATNYITEFDGVISTSTVTRNISARVLNGPGVPTFTYTILTNSTARWNALHDSIKVIVGSTISLMCSVNSVPNSTYTWDTGHEGSIITIVNITRTTNTLYNCTATNVIETSFKGNVIGRNYSSANLDLLYGPATIEVKYNNVTPIENTFKIIEGWSFTILCSASSNPAPRYSWFGPAAGEGNVLIIRNDETVELLCDADGDPEPIVRVMNTTRGNDSTLVEIKGRKVKYRIQKAKCEYDIGNYTCSAYNRYNEGRQLFALFVYYVVWYKRDDESWRVLSDGINFLVTISEDSMQTQLKIFHVQLEDYTDYMVNVSNTLGSTVDVFTLKAQSKPEVPIRLQVGTIGKTELVLKWIPGFDGGDSQTFTIRYKKLGDGSWMVIPIHISHYEWTVDGLKSGTTYQIQMMAQNKIGKSNWTEAIHVITLLDTVSSDSSTSALGGAVGGIFGVGVIIAVSILIWRYRSHGLNTTKQCLTKRNPVEKYEDLVRGQ